MFKSKPNTCPCPLFNKISPGRNSTTASTLRALICTPSSKGHATSASLSSAPEIIGSRSFQPHQFKFNSTRPIRNCSTFRPPSRNTTTSRATNPPKGSIVNFPASISSPRKTNSSTKRFFTPCGTPTTRPHIALATNKTPIIPNARCSHRKADPDVGGRIRSRISRKIGVFIFSDHR